MSWIESFNKNFGWVMSWIESFNWNFAWVMSRIESFNQNFCWVMSRIESLNWNFGWVMSWIESYIFCHGWVMSRIESLLKKCFESMPESIQFLKNSFWIDSPTIWVVYNPGSNYVVTSGEQWLWSDRQRQQSEPVLSQQWCLPHFLQRNRPAKKMSLVL